MKREAKELEMLQESLKAEQAKSEEYLNRLKYLQADFENYRRRVEKDFQEMTQRSNERLVTNLVTVLDDLERAIDTGRETENVKSLLEGVHMVYKNLCTILEREGLTRVEAVGKPFDPKTHEILAKVRTYDCKEDGKVIEEARKGYMFRGKVIRPSIVKIAYKE
jgi:molecular chaperone GrpE